ncbi:leucine-rich repeat-containing protein, partial [Tanacetum coccineum]
MIQNGNSKKRVTKGKDGVYRVLPPTTQEEQFADEKERKARTLLLQLMLSTRFIYNRFHGMDMPKRSGSPSIHDLDQIDDLDPLEEMDKIADCYDCHKKIKKECKFKGSKEVHGKVRFQTSCKLKSELDDHVMKVRSIGSDKLSMTELQSDFGDQEAALMPLTPRAWYATLSTFLEKHGYKRGTIDKTLFIRRNKKDIMLVQVYVDDIIFGSTNKSWCDEFEALMQSRFQMSSMGELTFFLGLQVKQNKGGIFISQDKYVAEILKKFDLVNVKAAITPMETKLPLTKDEEAFDVDVHLYRSMIGSLMYLTASRPDIMYAVCVCSRFQVTPKTSHLNAVKRIFKYLKGKPNLGVWYPRESPFDLEAFSDSDYGGSNLDRKSTTGGCQFLGQRLISWQCKKQTIVATSTTEAEYVAAANCCGQVLWVQNQLLDYGFNFMNTKIHIDNESTICIVKNPVYHSKTKHIEIRHHFIRDCYEKKLISVEKIHTDLNVADLLTKPFDGPRFNYLVVSIGFAEIVDFLRGSNLRYALTANPTIYDSLVKQFWQSAIANTKADGSLEINATIDTIRYTISEASIRDSLQLDDATGITMLPNDDLFEGMGQIGYPTDGTFTFWKSFFTPQWRYLVHHLLHCISSKSGGWDQFGSNIATALICLSTDSYPIMMNWNISTDCCIWNGVTCDRSTGDVIGIDLSCGMLSGTIQPNSSLFNLPHLQTLNLAFNNFTGSQIPSEIGRFSNSLTHLDLSSCGLSGQVPPDITLLHKLVSLDLSLNYVDDLKLEPHVFINMLRNFTNLEELSLPEVNISSVLPTRLNISSSLKLLNLAGSGLQGKLPHYIFNLQSLETLDLSANHFTGDIPSKISLNLTHLTFMGLSSNNLNGTLPSWLFTSPSLEYLFLQNNMFSGNVPFESFALPSLKWLDLSHNNQLSGQIDMQTFRQLTNLIELDLSYNNFSGEWELDTLLSSLTNLDWLDLSYSGFSVTTKNTNHFVNPGFWSLRLASCKLKVFPESFRAMKQLLELDLSGNEIHGQIPHWAGEIGRNELRLLNLSHNFITGLPQFQWYGLYELYLQSNLIEGPFPPSICNMSSLVFLDMSHNSFDGVIPQCVGNLSNSLEMMDLRNNSFQGTIPNVFGGFIHMFKGLILNGNQLEGGVPSSLSKCEFLTVLDLGNNHLNGTFPGWLEELRFLQ